MRYFTITTLGCKVNQYDGSAVAGALRRAGWSPAGPGRRPNLVLVNTCCVTATAMRKSRQAIRRAVRAAPSAAVFVLGCYGAADPARLRRLLRTLGVPDGNVLIAGNHDDLSARVSRFIEGNDSLSYETTEGRKGFDEFHDESGLAHVKKRRKDMLRGGCVGTEGLGLLREFAGHQRAFVKVQDGCDAFCNYCIVPYARPRVWSRREEDILAECRQLVEAGHKEIVLCGVFLGAFGRATAIRRKWDNTPSKLPQLVRKVSEIPGLWRVRLSSLEPGDVSDELLAVLRDASTAAPHLHLPLQNGSDRILRRMNRQYRSADYRDAVSRLREALNRPAVTTDIIVGYPGETDDDFAETLAVAREAGFAKIHIFPFSPLEPTGAWLRRDEIPSQGVVRKRLEQLSELEAKLAQNYRGQFVGETLEGLVENATTPNGKPVSMSACRSALLGKRTRKAMTSRYLTVAFPASSGDDLTGRIVNLKITGVTDEGLLGKHIS
ncbi:MAG: MiaB/RimO family radical SAM methylthiotransferase [Phycisphaerae bacterium]|nr:MiaB/RimO family radical SAM methylthiotransferase [Phycisphaerae bacterium]